ncbi:hypothetical protein IAR55_005919 [Kwoniella newhampshirensis]|uniref:Alpha-1,3/1,6-mannosyltransferase ALG2 n=1 Tax=Kwoniella newhampshirensis TaxID=1651941 RepID=A0AAW0YYP4_9TREE
MDVNNAKKKMRIGFIHPDLGIGGAERLVVDAAVALQRRGHDVVMFTSRHDPTRCFPETIDGTLTVHVLGSFLPRTLHPRLPLTIVFSILRSLTLAFLLIFSLLLPGPPTPMNPLSPIEPFDIFFIDQQSVAIPLLRFMSGTRVVFYCHFPDKLLSGGWEINVDAKGQEGMSTVERKTGTGSVSVAKRLYRWPIDKLEEVTTGQSDVVLSNSKFTSRVYARAFPSLAQRSPRVVYPCVDIKAYQPSERKGKGEAKVDDAVKQISSDRPTIVSFNRFEAKKNVGLAIRTYARLGSDKLIPDDQFRRLRLVIGGGYDSEELDNRHTLAELQSLCEELSLSYHTFGESTMPPSNLVQVLFILNFSNAQRTYLLTSPTTRCLLYTPANEHFGIVPIEAMSCGLPVLAADSGGPTETILDLSTSDSGTGILRPPQAEAWAPALASLIVMTGDERSKVKEAARARVKDEFSMEKLGSDLEQAFRDALAMGDLHVYLGDKLIWGGAMLMGTSAVGLALIIWLSG